MAILPGPSAKKLGRKKSAKPPKSEQVEGEEKDVEKGPEIVEQPKTTERRLSQSNVSRSASTRTARTHDKEKDKEKEKGDDDKLEYDPEDDVWTLDEGKASPGRKYAHSLMNAFRPVLWLANILGLFPLVPHRASNGTYSVKFSWLSFFGIHFVFCSTIVIGTTIWMFVSVILITINVPDKPDTKYKSGEIYRSEEVYVYKRNIVIMVVMLCSFLNMTICMIAVFFRRDYIAKQLVYWTEVVELLQLDVGRHVARKLTRHLVFLLAFVIGIVGIYVLGHSPMISGSGSTLYIVLARVIDPLCHWNGSMYIRRAVFAFYLLYIIIGGYIYILWFFFNCRILTNILRIWNNRFQFCLHKQILEFTNVQQSRDIRLGARAANRTSRAHLFQDHLVIFNLLEGVNAQFEVIMESFYLSSMVMIVFEAYGFVHACFYHEYSKCGRQFDIIPLLMFLVLQLYMYIVVTLEAAGVADEARHVLDIVRRKGMMTSRMDNELWFMLSMRLSFGGHEDVGIIGAGFFYITKSFLLGAISAMMSHFIIYYQFAIPYAQTVEGDGNLVLLDQQRLIWQLEGRKHSSTC